MQNLCVKKQHVFKTSLPRLLLPGRIISEHEFSRNFLNNVKENCSVGGNGIFSHALLLVAGRLQGGPLQDGPLPVINRVITLVIGVLTQVTSVPFINGVTLLTLICRGRDVFRLSPLLQPKNPGIPHVLFR